MQSPPPSSSVSAGYLTTSTPAAARGGRRGAFAAGFVVFLLLVGILTGVLLAHRHGTGATGMDSVVPSSSLVYATADLVPGGAQGTELLSALNHLGVNDGSLSQTLTTLENSALSGSGMSHSNLSSWFTNQVGYVAGVSSSSASDGAILLGSSSDAGATAFLATLRSRSHALQLGTFSATSYDGVNYWTSHPAAGTLGAGGGDGDDHGSESCAALSGGSATSVPTTCSADPGLLPGEITTSPSMASASITLAVTNDTVILAASTGGNYMQTLLATATGRSAAIDSNTAYSHALSLLPASSIGRGYVSMAGLGQQVSGEVGSISALAAGPLSSAFAAYRGLAFSLRATTHGLEINLVLTYSQPQSSVLTSVTGSGIERYIPATAGAFGAVTGLNQALGGLVKSGLPGLALTAAGDGGAAATLSTVAGLLTGPAAGFVDAHGSGGAVIVGITNRASALAVLGKLRTMACSDADSGDPTVTCRSSLHTTTDAGVTINSLTSTTTYDDQGIPASDSAGFDDLSDSTTVAWAATSSVAVIGSSTAEVEAALNAPTGANIGGDPTLDGDLGLQPGAAGASFVGFVNIHQLDPGAGGVGSVVVTVTGHTEDATAQMDIVTG